MSRLEIFVSKNNKKSNFAVAVGLINLKNSFLKEIEIKDDAKSAVFFLVKKFQKKGIKFSEIILNGTENYFSGTPLENYVTVLKKPELFFSDFIELKSLRIRHLHLCLWWYSGTPRRRHSGGAY